MIHNVVDFRNVKASDVMVPIAKVVTVRPDTSIDETLKRSAAADVDRLPIISEGQAIGILNIFDIVFDQTRRETVANYSRRIVTATEDEPAYRIVQRLRAARLGLAAVVDSRKQLVGIITGEDIIQRLVQIGAL